MTEECKDNKAVKWNVMEVYASALCCAALWSLIFHKKTKRKGDLTHRA